MTKASSFRNSQSWIDLRTLEDLGDKTIIVSVISTFLIDMPNRITEMGLAFDSRNWTQLRFLSHQGRSSSSALGLGLLTGEFEKLEEAARSTSIDDAKKALERSKILFEEAGKELEKELATRSSKV